MLTKIVYTLVVIFVLVPPLTAVAVYLRWLTN